MKVGDLYTTGSGRKTHRIRATAAQFGTGMTACGEFIDPMTNPPPRRRDDTDIPTCTRCRKLEETTAA